MTHSLGYGDTVRSCRRRKETGATLLEIAVALAILSVALLALVAVVLQSNRLQEQTRERTLAYNAIRNVLEKLRNEALEEVYARYNSNPADDPGGPGTAPGREFDVEGLLPPSNRRSGRIEFPESGTPPTLREDVQDEGLGMPTGRDLNRDGGIDAGDRSRDYKILPVRIRVEWMGGGRLKSLESSALLSRK